MRRPADPVFVEDRIDPSILAGQSVLADDVASAAVRPGSGRGGPLLLSLLAVCVWVSGLYGHLRMYIRGLSESTVAAS